MATCVNCAQCPGKVYPQLQHEIKASPKDILVIGEALTPLECRTGKMMTGTAVDILKQAMQKAKLPIGEDKVHYTVGAACAVPKRKGRPYPKEPFLNCRVRLLDEIRKVNPRIIITLGKFGLQALTGNFAIKVTEEYGRVRQYDFCGDAQVVPVIHPAMLIRAPGEYKGFAATIQLITQLYNNQEIHNTGEVQWTVLETDEACDKAITFLKENIHKVNADIETTGLDYRFVEFLVMGICYKKNRVLIVPHEMRHRLQDFFDIKGIRWTWHHGKYDSKVLWRRGLGDMPHHDDTIYMHYVLNETPPHDLGYLTKMFLQAEEYKYKMNQNWKAVSMESYPQFFEALCERVAVDCDYGFQLQEKLQEELDLPENNPLKKLYENFTMPTARFLSRIEQNGMLTDEVYLEKLNKRYEAELVDILMEIHELSEPYWDRELYMKETEAKSAPEMFNPGSPAQMAWMVYDRLKLKPRRKKGRSTDAEVLKSIEEDVDLIKMVLKYRSVQKEQSTYIKGNLDKRDLDGRVRSTFSMHIAATGRSTSKEPNVQNIPSAHGVANVRKAFIPPKDYILAEIDYSGAELRWLAFLSQCPVLMDVFKEGRNLHHETSVALYGENYTKQQKMRAKAVNFGIPYGREYKSFMDEFNISKEEAIAMVEGWLNKYYGAKKYLQWCAEQVIEGNYLQTPWGQRRRFGLVTPQSLHALQNEARNFPIQSSSSHLLFYAGMDVEKRLLKEFDTRIINMVHDSMVLEVPKDGAILQQVASYVTDRMIKLPIELFDCPVPFQTDTEVGPSWGELQTYNYKTGNIEIEEGDTIVETPFEEWIEKVYHYDIYEKSWYKRLVPREYLCG